MVTFRYFKTLNNLPPLLKAHPWTKAWCLSKSLNSINKWLQTLHLTAETFSNSHEFFFFLSFLWGLEGFINAFKCLKYNATIDQRADLCTITVSYTEWTLLKVSINSHISMYCTYTRNTLTLTLKDDQIKMIFSLFLTFYSLYFEMLWNDNNLLSQGITHFHGRKYFFNCINTSKKIYGPFVTLRLLYITIVKALRWLWGLDSCSNPTVSSMFSFEFKNTWKKI